VLKPLEAQLAEGERALSEAKTRADRDFGKDDDRQSTKPAEPALAPGAADGVVNGKPLDPSVKPAESLLLMPCAEGKVFPAGGKNTAANVYQGAYWEVFRKRKLPSGATPVDNWLILSAKHGLMDPGQMIGPYDERMTPERAQELIAQCRSWCAPIGACSRHTSATSRSWAAPITAR
jgi:hypothetical protein